MRFPTTQWSVVLSCNLDQRNARQAISRLFEAYSDPLYVFGRRPGFSAEDARDLVQGFFTHLLKTNGLHRAHQVRGRFRSYFLAAFKNYLSNKRKREMAAKRGGGETIVSLDAIREDRFDSVEPIAEETPEKVYEYRWALSMIQRSLEHLRSEWENTGRGELFEQLKDYLAGDQLGSYRGLAARLGMREGALRVAVHRLQRRFALVVRAKVAATVTHPADVEAEMRFLLAILKSGS